MKKIIVLALIALIAGAAAYADPAVVSGEFILGTFVGDLGGTGYGAYMSEESFSITAKVDDYNSVNIRIREIDRNKNTSSILDIDRAWYSTDLGKFFAIPAEILTVVSQIGWGDFEDKNINKMGNPFESELVGDFKLNKDTVTYVLKFGVMKMVNLTIGTSYRATGFLGSSANAQNWLGNKVTPYPLYVGAEGSVSLGDAGKLGYEVTALWADMTSTDGQGVFDLGGYTATLLYQVAIADGMNIKFAPSFNGVPNGRANGFAHNYDYAWSTALEFAMPKFVTPFRVYGSLTGSSRPGDMFNAGTVLFNVEVVKGTSIEAAALLAMWDAAIDSREILDRWYVAVNQKIGAATLTFAFLARPSAAQTANSSPAGNGNAMGFACSDIEDKNGLVVSKVKDDYFGVAWQSTVEYGFVIGLKAKY